MRKPLTITATAALTLTAAATLTACGGSKSGSDKYMNALMDAHFPVTLLADRTDALKVGHDMCGSDETAAKFQLMSQLNLKWTQVQALDTAAHKYLCK